MENNSYDTHLKLCDMLRKIAVDNNVCIVTATQVPRPDGPLPPMRTKQTPDIVIIDYLNLIK